MWTAFASVLKSWQGKEFGTADPCKGKMLVVTIMGLLVQPSSKVREERKRLCSLQLVDYN